MYPKEFEFSFVKDSYYFVGAMCLVLVVGFVVTIPKLIEFDYGTVEITFRAIDLLTIAVPPSLPAVLSSCILFAIKRLNTK